MRDLEPTSGPLPIVFVITLGLGAWLLWLSARSLLERRRWSYALGTVVSHGAVTRSETALRGHDPHRLEVGFQFRAEDGREFRFVEQIPVVDVIPDYNVGAPVRVRYRAEDPKATADTHASGSLAGAILLMMIGLLLALPPTLLFAIRSGFLESVFARRPLDAVGFVVCVSAGVAVFLVPALVIAVARAQFLSSAVAGQLRVVGYQKDEIVLTHTESESGSAESSAPAEYAQLELTAPPRQALKIGERVRSGPASRPYAVGDAFPVLFSPTDPQGWIRNAWTSRWLAAALLAGMGLLLIGAGCLQRPSAEDGALETTRTQ